MAKSKEIQREKRHKRTRKTISGSTERPRLCVHRSLNNIQAQIVDDTKGATIVAASSFHKDLRSEKGHKGNMSTAKKVGELIGRMAIDKGIKQVVFDRGGYLYHGRVKALADGAREAGLEF
ncbi:50S ribosomal protein L18 [Nitrospirota bacterium]